MVDISDIRERLAKIEATQDHQSETLARIDDKLDGISGRLRDVEVKSAVAGTLAGGVVSVCIAMISAKLKSL